MKTRTVFVNLLTWLAILWAFSTAWAGPLVLTWVTDNTPGGDYIVGEGSRFQEKNPGIEIELYQMAAKKLNFELQLKRMPWKQCLEQLESNQVDGIFPASYKPDRKKIGVYPMRGEAVDMSRRSRKNAYYLYKMKGSPVFWDGKKLHDARGLIGVPSGWAIVSDIRKMGLDVKELPVHRNSPDLLLLGRVEGFICLETVFDAYLKRNASKYADIVKESKPVWEKPYYLMLSHQFVRERPELAQEIWDAIYEIQQTAEFEDVVQKYVK
ncbi:amino acid ABC transporter periplasmic protein [Desulfatibacillum aliphaticivorans]|uniref:Amino acid ABC transporter periplasmic protein n=1 Tax=Desulfatibacillum aliphaticivorans TaxID=218208 RepID=B8FHG1_DESAL|nr:transporter substrate-binding domain-containing protein [Desulfatibacillum aliphaticivorans]ACL02249.1 amino acid ABC transporter periplasmic protein [Desulfatibacillum aliphaticivorans]